MLSQSIVAVAFIFNFFILFFIILFFIILFFNKKSKINQKNNIYFLFILFTYILYFILFLWCGTLFHLYIFIVKFILIGRKN